MLVSKYGSGLYFRLCGGWVGKPLGLQQSASSKEVRCFGSGLLLCPCAFAGVS